MTERTLHYSLDSNKAKTLNVPSLVSEALSQIDNHEKLDLPDINYKIIIDELNFRLKENKAIKNIVEIPMESLRLGRDDAIVDLKRKLEILSARASGYAYIQYLFSELKSNIETAQKGEIVFYVDEIITTLINIGVSAAHLYFSTKNIFTKKQNLTKNGFERFTKVIFPYTHTFRVCLKILPLNDAASGIDLSIFGIEFGNNIPEDMNTAKPSPEFSHRGKSKYVLIDDIDNYDVHSAVMEARDRIGTYLNLFKMFDHKVEFSIFDECLVDQCCIEGINAVKHSVNRMHYVSWQRRDNISGLLSDVVRNVRLRRSSDYTRFMRVIDIHGMALSTQILESQIISLWSCFETIIPGNPQKSTIETICRKINPIIGLNYIGRLMHDLYDHCKNVAPAKFWSEIKLSGNDVKLELRLFTEIIVNKSNHDILSRALGQLGEYPLLRYKIFKLADRFSNPKKIVTEIENHMDRVRWQIRRLYRTRNQIVHAGITPSFASHLLENGHDYFDQIFMTVCYLSSGAKGLKTLEHCFDFAEISYNNYMSMIKATETINDELAQNLIWFDYHP